MITKKYLLAGLIFISALAISLTVPQLSAQDQSGTAAAKPRNLEPVLDKALTAMKKRAEELNVKGVALVAYAEGDTVQAWTSKMVVVGHMTDGQSATRKGNNLLGIAYTKAAEMADTLKDSGSKVRPPMSGEYGYQGGLVAKGKTGILIVAFSGGPSEDDLKVSHAGMEIMSSDL